MPDTLPDRLLIDAWLPDEGPAEGAPGPGAIAWGIRRDAAPLAGDLAPPPAVPLTAWHDPAVGWGLVLPMPAAGQFTPAQLATAADAPEPLRDLVAARGDAPVLRYLGGASPHLRRFYSDGSSQDLGYLTDKLGTAKAAVPFYLLIAAGPEAIPWDVQYALGRMRAVGRLALEGDALARYVAALIDDWQDDPPSAGKAVVWATDHGAADITRLMAAVVAEPIRAALAADDEIGAGAVGLAKAAASAGALVDALVASRPALIVTSSHGQTGPLDDAPAMAAALGLPIDAQGRAVTADALLQGWSPGGALWFAQACCSAGSTAASAFTDLLGPGTSAHRVLAAVAGLGDRVAPLPTALLGASRPLRAFVGHVEPTFDWTLRDTENGQPLTASLIEAFYPRLYRREPIGLALQRFRSGGSALHGLHDDAVRGVNAMAPGAAERAVRLRLMARDRGSLVILGDPTVCLPPLPSQLGGS